MRAADIEIRDVMMPPVKAKGSLTEADARKRRGQSRRRASKACSRRSSSK